MRMTPTHCIVLRGVKIRMIPLIVDCKYIFEEVILCSGVECWLETDGFVSYTYISYRPP